MGGGGEGGGKGGCEGGGRGGSSNNCGSVPWRRHLQHPVKGPPRSRSAGRAPLQSCHMPFSRLFPHKDILRHRKGISINYFS